MAFNSRAGGKGSAKRPSGVSMEVVDANHERIFGKKNKVNTDAAQDVFELSPSGYEKAKAFLKENGLEDQIQKEQSTDGFTLVALANKLYKDNLIEDSDVIFVAKHPGYIAKIEKLPAGVKILPLAVSGMTFDICKDQLCVIAQSRVDCLEQELKRAKDHLQSVLELKESDVK